MTLKVEYNSNGDTEREDIENNIVDIFKKRIGIHIIAEVSSIGTLPRSEKKSKRIIDYRHC
jgi:phenylacetate-CoA ligase